MTDDRSLADLIETAARRHNDASGRQLALLAGKAGHEVSHATLNRIRTGKYEARPSDSTLRAIAYLAGVPEHVTFDAASPERAARTPEHVFEEWYGAWSRAENLTIEYARLRELRIDDAGQELRDLLVMFREHQAELGRPWTPPWDVGLEFSKGDRPWSKDWWFENDATGLREEDAGERLKRPDLAGQTINVITAPPWVRHTSATGTTDEDTSTQTPAPDPEADGTAGVTRPSTTGAAGRGDRKLSALPGGKQGSSVDGRLPKPDPADFLAAQTMDPKDASLRPADQDDESQDHGSEDPA